MPNETLPSLPLLAEWERRLQITWLAPARMLALPGQEAKPAPRSNLVLSLVPVQTEKTTAAAREAFMEQTAAAVPGLQEIERADVTFADGTPGSVVVVEFQANADARLRQQHFFRIDGGTLAQMVATVDAEVAEDEDMLREAALSYTPPS